MLSTLSRVADAFWRAAAYCLHPRVIALSLLPLLIAGPLAWGLMYFFWEPAVDGVRASAKLAPCPRTRRACARRCSSPSP